MPPAAITVLGSFIVDFTCQTLRLPRWGETLLGAASKLGPGGKGSNQAVAARRAGARVAFLTKVGDDLFGRMADDLARDEGYSRSVVLRSATRGTGTAAILVDAGTGENAIVVVPGACQELTVADIDAHTGMFTACGIFLTQLEANLDATFHALGLAKAHGAFVILNPAPAAPVPARVLRLVDLLTPNESEAEALTGIDCRTAGGCTEAARRLREDGVRSVIVTRGAAGILIDDGTVTLLAALDAGRAVDTAGAGDAFNGVLAAGLATGMSLHEAARLGMAAAAISVTREGTTQAMPSHDDIHAVISRAHAAPDRG